MANDREHEGLDRQIGGWIRVSDIYQREIDQRLVSVIDNVITQATLTAGQRVLNLGTGPALWQNGQHGPLSLKITWSG